MAESPAPARRREPGLTASRWTTVRRLVAEHPGAALGVTFIVVLVLWSLFGPLPYDPRGTDGSASREGPSGTHWFGTDGTGGDVFSRVIEAAKIDLSLALAGTAVALVIGVPLGLAASTKGKGSQRLVRGLDAFQAFPLLILALALVSLSGNQLYMVVVAIALLNIPRYMRLLRSEVLAIRESRFVEAATAMGASTPRLIFRHLLPNVWGVILVQTSLTIANSIVVLSSLSFLGVGVSAPTPSWGSMIRDGAGNMSSGEWWIATFPGLAVLLCVLAFNQLADAIGDRTARSYR
ncbi:MAG: ABC transporter permease [Aeromicrobium sp.]|uniref:ABC transporter permease n=1 Tax=Aeromicrobium sp. TaxID=1871063 RepID=UPI0025C49592|nr:ABC transporter permease [Aeromicrobium sp.]MCK5891462.1 ABC transporter permease [Aeromicrobium sp.]MDF1704703.1 ABC transporter permease [Aeromicrobium sp.]